MLEPPTSSKTIERWESTGRVKRWRLVQLADIYGVPVDSLNGKKAA